MLTEHYENTPHIQRISS